MATFFSKDGEATTTINRFDGGVAVDPRDPRDNVARVISNFDVLTSPKKMTPHRDSESGDSAPTTSRKQNFCIALFDGGTSPDTYTVYALGVVSGQTYAEILYKKLTRNSTEDLTDNLWIATVNNQSGSGTPNFNLFVFYRKTGYIYGARNGSHIFRYDPDGTDAWADTHRVLTYTRIGQGVVHSKDDILYIPCYEETNANGYTSFIAKNDNATWTNNALVLPVHYIPTSICEYGDYLAIGCADANGLGNSRVFLWDRNSSLVDIDESIDWGTGSLMILEEIDGELVGISQRGGTSTSFAGLPTQTTAHKDRVIFRKLVGNKAVKIMELRADQTDDSNYTRLPAYKQKVDNRLYFQMLIGLNGSVRDGVWSIGKNANGEWTLIHERTSNNNTALDDNADSLTGFIVVGDYIFQSYLVGGSTYTLTKSNDTGSWTANSIYESKIFDLGDSSTYKDLMEVTVTNEYLPAAGEVAMAYQVDENIGTTTWTTIFTNSTNNSVGHSAMNIESTGAQLPKSYRQISFRIISTGNAEITGFSFKEKIIGKKYIAD